jgi:hypothetical protein
VNARERASSPTGFSKTSKAPAFIARMLAWTSRTPVMKKHWRRDLTAVYWPR